METSHIVQFCRSVATWPKNESDLKSIAEQLRSLLDVPGAMIWAPGIGTGAQGFGDSQQRIQSMLSSETSSQGGDVRLIQLGEDRAVQVGGARLAHLALVPITGEIRVDSMPPGTRKRHEFGWLAVLSEKALNGKTAFAFLGVAQHLSSLGISAEAENAIQLRDRFLSIASHELKTPLTSIYGILQLQERMLRPKPVAQSTQEQDKQLSFFRMVIRQVERLNELIDGLLDVSRIQNGRFIVQPSEADIAAIIRETISARLNVIAQEASVRIQVDAPESLVVSVDPVRFEEVVTNLGMNAIRYSPEGGVVWMKLRIEGNYFVLSIRDQGPAVPDVDRNRIFQPFERAQRTGRLGGLGLGLFISRQIAQLHGGNVVLAESNPGKGNLFEARFPVRTERKLSA